ncbi:MAG: hypothetical protein LBM96_10000, partial [Methanobrevibacter sp.]|nr:hypothetical protein [Candidatus Methanoflexus mossambicus]
MILNSLYKDYILFEKIVNKHDPDSDYINLRHVPFIKPTTILPVFNFMNEIGINHYYPNYNTRNYLRRVFRVTKNKSTTIPIKRLPSNLKDKDKFDIIEEIRSLLTRNYVEPQ